MAEYLFVACQFNAQNALKHEMARRWPEVRLAYSRPGFVTFKVPKVHPLLKDLDLECTLARAAGYAIGHVDGDSDAERAAKLWQLVAGREFDAMHVWRRDLAVPGDHNFEPGPSPETHAAEAAIRAASTDPRWHDAPAYASALPVAEGAIVLDAILVEPETWWVGYHRATTWESRFAGGVVPAEMPEDAVSRAYLKMEEALAWSQLPIAVGDTCVEIGAAPGGASQALLARGLVVNGIDPAEIDERVLAHPHFHHIQARGADLKRREFRGIRWLMCDMNVTPRATLDTVESIVNYAGVNVRGMLVTLKLPEWEMVDELAGHAARVKSWGYREVRIRQLAHNRREVCLAALKHRDATHDEQPAIEKPKPRRKRKPANFAPLPPKPAVDATPAE